MGCGGGLSSLLAGCGGEPSLPLVGGGGGLCSVLFTPPPIPTGVLLDLLGVQWE